jgi:hypothetical protein
MWSYFQRAQCRKSAQQGLEPVRTVRTRRVLILIWKELALFPLFSHQSSDQTDWATGRLPPTMSYIIHNITLELTLQKAYPSKLSLLSSHFNTNQTKHDRNHSQKLSQKWTVLRKHIHRTQIFLYPVSHHMHMDINKTWHRSHTVYCPSIH